MPQKPIVLLTDPIADAGIRVLKESCELITPWVFGRSYSEDELARADGVIVRLTKFTAETIRGTAKLKVIGRHGVGVDNIDLNAATEKGIPVVFTPSALTMANAVAEHTVHLMMALARHAVAADRMVRERNFSARASLMALEFRDKTLGIVGLGAIGKRVAEICQKGFSMRIVAFDPYLSGRPAGIEVTLVGSLRELLEQADVVTLHLPSTPETGGLIGAEALERMKPSALLINVARGAIVDSVALAQALHAGRILGAALDVFEEEPPPAGHPLLTAPRTLFSPHVASMTAESMARMAELVARQVVKALHGERPDYVANPAVFEQKR